MHAAHDEQSAYPDGLEATLARRGWLPPLLLALLVIVLLRPALLPAAPGHALNGTDFRHMFYPLQDYIRATLLDGDLPLWNPHQFAGHPIPGNPHSGLFYPAQWLVWLVGVPRGIGLALALHSWWGAWGGYRLLRSFDAGQVGSLLAGAIIATGGWAGARYYAGHYNLLLVYAWVPWLAVAYRYALRHGSLTGAGGWWAALPGMGAFGAALLAGYPPLLIYGGLLLLALAVYHVLTAEQRGDTPRRAAWVAGGHLVALGAGGLILAAALVLPAVELARLSAREANDLSFASSHALPPAQIVSALALPHLYGNPTVEPYFYWGADFVEEFTAYAGLLPLIALALAIRWPQRHGGLFVALIAFGLVWSVGLDGTLMPLAVRWIPGAGFFRVPARALLLVVIGLAGLTALLVTALQTSRLETRQDRLAPALRGWLPLAGAGALALSVFFSGWYASASHVEPMPLRASLVAGALATAGVILAGVWLVLWWWTRPDPPTARWAVWATVLLVIVDAWHITIPLITTGDVSEAPIWQGARSNIPAVTTLSDDASAADVDRAAGRVLSVPPFGGPENTASVTGHLHVLGYDPQVVETFDALTTVADPGDPLSRAYTLLGVRFLLATEPIDDPQWTLIGAAYDSFYYERTDPFPRAWIAAEIVVEPDDAAARARLLDPATDPRRTVFLAELLDCPSDDDAASAMIAAYGPNEVTVQTDGGGGVLVLSDQYFPGWRATVDGDTADAESATIVRADTLFRAVCVPPGAHTVTFRYRPPSLILGLIVSGISWGVWLGLLLTGFWRRRRRAHQR